MANLLAMGSDSLLGCLLYRVYDHQLQTRMLVQAYFLYHPRHRYSLVVHLLDPTSILHIRWIDGAMIPRSMALGGIGQGSRYFYTFRLTCYVGPKEVLSNLFRTKKFEKFVKN